MKPIRFELNNPEYKAPVITCKNWLGREVKFFFKVSSAQWVNTVSFKRVERGSTLSLKLCTYAELQIHLIGNK